MKQYFLLPNRVKRVSRCGFSLVEMLMALLVASLLLAALAPVMTKRLRENVNVSGVGEKSMQEMTLTLNYSDEYCTEIDEENNICKGEFTIPAEAASMMKVTAIGAGGGGGAAASTGYVEYTTAGTHTFTVPAGVYEIEAALVSGGGGGQAGKQIKKNVTFVVSGNGNPPPAEENAVNTTITASGGTGSWTIPDVAKTNVIIARCGGGGGAGAGKYGGWGIYRYGGGSGGYFTNVANLAGETTLNYIIGGGGGGGGGTYQGTPGAGQPYGGGGGGGGGKSDGINHYIRALGHSPNGGHGAGSVTDGSTWTSDNPQDTAPRKSYTATAGLAQQQGSGGAGGAGGTMYTAATTGGNGGTMGGGGGATLHWASCYHGGGGGGGGVTMIYSATKDYGGGAGGGGGASGYSPTDWSAHCPKSVVAGGGGGAGVGGGAGGGGIGGDDTNETLINPRVGKGAQGGANAKGIYGGDIKSVFGSNYCNGGNSNLNGRVGENGKNGAIRITYLDYGTGGYGGASGAFKSGKIRVIPGETLYITVGTGGKGGTAGGRIDAAKKEVMAPIQPTRGTISAIYRGSTNSQALLASGESGTPNVSTTSYNGAAGGVSPVAELRTLCAAGAGGTASVKSASNANGYGGCGGGGGYSMTGNGGAGSGGYVKIIWNPNKIGTGGGGGSGNYIENRMVTINPGATIPFQIGKGGKGGYIENNILKEAKSGGNTIFGTGNESTDNFNISAGGGGAGGAVYLKADNSVTNGLGGEAASLCKIGVKNVLICTASLTGEPGGAARGGNGGASKFGEGAAGGIFGGTVQPAENIGAGGGGAGIYNAGKVNEGAESTINQSKGSTGGNGQIILQWYMK